MTLELQDRSVAVNDATKMCELLEVQLNVSEPRENYTYALGDKGYRGKPVIGTWEITIADMQNNP